MKGNDGNPVTIDTSKCAADRAKAQQEVTGITARAAVTQTLVQNARIDNPNCQWAALGVTDTFKGAIEQMYGPNGMAYEFSQLTLNCKPVVIERVQKIVVPAAPPKKKNDGCVITEEKFCKRPDGTKVPLGQTKVPSGQIAAPSGPK